MMKGFIDRAFLPGITFVSSKENQLPQKLLKGKSSRIIFTSESPRWYHYLFMRSPVINQFKKGTLQFCGINPVRVTHISPIKGSSEAFRAKWLTKIESLGVMAQ